MWADSGVLSGFDSVRVSTQHLSVTSVIHVQSVGRRLCQTPQGTFHVLAPGTTNPVSLHLLQISSLYLFN